jgi:hypothetical protein
MVIQAPVGLNNLIKYNQQLIIKKIFDAMVDIMLNVYHSYLQPVKPIKLEQQQIMPTRLIIYLVLIAK